MLTVRTATELRSAGLTWSPTSGDRFVVADRDMDDAVFVVSEMVIEHARDPSGDVLRFNGTMEWALDHVYVEAALWLPREDQLRALLGPQFVALAQISPGSWSVTTADGEAYSADDPEEAYATALLARLRG